MKASDYRGAIPRAWPWWHSALSAVPVYLIGVPLMRLLEAFRFSPPKLVQSDCWGDYRPGPNDVLACSFFKSGTTWLLQIATQIAFRGDAEFEWIHDVVPWPDALPNERKYVIPLSDPSPQLYSPTGKRVIKTHLPFSGLPPLEGAKMIAVVRDPKDVCVSGYHFIKGVAMGPMMTSVPSHLRIFLEPDCYLGDWAEHCASWWAIRDRPDVLFLTYEEMRADLPGTVRRIAAFMGVDLAPAEFDRVVERSSFAWMRAHQSMFNFGKPRSWLAGEVEMVRAGRSGAAGTLLSQAQLDLIDETFSARLKALGCDFPYDTLYGRARAG
jgi:Sulfotransferase domain